MTKRTTYKREQILRDISTQRKWIEQCGGTLAGYIANYHGIHGRTMDEAKAIHGADQDELRRLENSLATRVVGA